LFPPLARGEDESENKKEKGDLKIAVNARGYKERV
jgi:hypothetical protein